MLKKKKYHAKLDGIDHQTHFIGPLEGRVLKSRTSLRVEQVQGKFREGNINTVSYFARIQEHLNGFKQA